MWLDNVSGAADGDVGQIPLSLILFPLPSPGLMIDEMGGGGEERGR
jgi:hypothetical protein